MSDATFSPLMTSSNSSTCWLFTNTIPFHWHLTEDQGWRIEIKKYPRLTEVGAYRQETVLPKTRDQYDGVPYGGFYTQDEIRAVVAYAAERGITVVPEIEMPGHAVAALTAYPELGCAGKDYQVRTTWGIAKDIYCAGKDEVFRFLQDVLAEVLELFPGEYIHIGGDEAPKKRWKSCPACQARIKEEGLADEHELQSWFIRQIDNWLTAKGKRPDRLGRDPGRRIGIECHGHELARQPRRNRSCQRRT